MNHDAEILHELCETIMRDIEECNKEIRMAGGELKSGNIEYIDKLTHALKSIKTVIAMIESDDGYSGRYMMPRYYYEDGGSRGDNSYARGGGRNTRRDSRGRYSREGGYSREGRYSRDGGYSYAAEMDDIVDELKEMMGELPDEKRSTIRQLISELEK